MIKVAGAALGVWVAIMAPAAPSEVAWHEHAEPTASDGGAPSCTPADRCCRVCEGGQACGKTCISRTKTCHVGRGCACNASEVCAN